MSEDEKGLNWLEDHVEEAGKGLDLMVAEIYSQLQNPPERLAIADLLRSGRKHLKEIKDESFLSRRIVTHHVKALERWGIVSSKMDKAPEGYPAILVRYVGLTPLGQNMLKYLESQTLGED